jgi:hypothetical protein
MPNHLTTVCTVTGDLVAIYEFRSLAIRDAELGTKCFDLSQVVPQPPIVSETESGTEAEAGFYALTGMVQSRFFRFGAKLPIETYRGAGFAPGPMDTYETFANWLAENKPDVLEKGRKSLQCFRETGHVSWYEWCYANWGTKWNSYDFVERSDEPNKYVFEFQTANGIPEPIDEGGPEYEGTFAVGAACECEKKDPGPERYRFVRGRDPYPEGEDEASTEDDAPN